VQVDGKCPQIAETIPYGPSDSQIDGLQLDGKSQTIERVDLGHVSIGRAQGTSDLSFSNYDLTQVRQLSPKVANERTPQRAGQPDLTSFLGTRG
jgi:hypothetical protein